MRRFISILLTIIGLPVIMLAANTVSVASSTAHPGDTVTVAVSLTTTDASVAIQLEIPLSEQLTFVEGSAVLTSSRVTGAHNIAASCNNGKLSLLVYSTNNTAISVGSGVLLSFKVVLNKEPGVYSITPSVVLSDRNARKLACSVTNGSITIRAAKIALQRTRIDYGHVPIRSTYSENLLITNIGNEALHISNIQSTSAEWTLPVTSLTIPAGTSGTISVVYQPQTYGADSANLTIVSNAAYAAMPIRLVADPYSVNELHTSSASGLSGSEVTVTLNMNNMEDIVAAQCSFMLPEGLDFVEGSAQLMTRCATHAVGTTCENRKLSFFVYNLQNSAIQGNNGDILQFRLALNGTGGNYQLVPTEVVLSNRQQMNMLSDATGSVVRIYSPLISAPDSLYFADIPLEHSSIANYLVTNNGETPLVINRISFTDSVHFSLDGVLPIEISAGQSQSISIRYTPTDAGSFSAQMLLYSNDPETKMKEVQVLGHTFASNYLQLSGTKVPNTSIYQMGLALENTTEVVALQFDIHWLADVMLADTSVVKSSRAANHAIAVTPLGNGVWRVFLYSLTNQVINDHSGSLLHFNFTIPADVNILGSEVSVDNIIMSTAQNENCTSQAQLIYQVNSGVVGDANGDGLVTITDAVAVVNYTLEQHVPSFCFNLADVNGDGQISVVDAVRIIQMIISE